MGNGIKKRLRKSLGFLLLLVMLTAMTAYAQDEEGTSGVPGEKDGNITVKGNVSGDLLENADKQQKENGTGTEGGKKLPTVTESRITWDGGELRIPVDLGDYSEQDDVSVSGISIVSAEQGYHYNSRFNASLEGNMVIVPFHDLVEVSDREQILSKAGDYTVRVGFYTEEGESSESEFTLHVPSDSTAWKVMPAKVKFDGNEDITFSFVNGTNYYELESIRSLEVFVGKGGVNAPDFTSGFTYDMKAGTLTIEKEKIKEALRYSKKILEGYGLELGNEAFLNVHAKTSKGVEVAYFNRIVWEEYGYGATAAWEIDFTDCDLTEPEPAPEPEPTPTPSENTVSEFTGTGSEELSISEESAVLIEKSALAYIQKHYAEQLAALGEDYKITSRLNLVSQSETNVQQAVKDAFSAQLKGKKIGQYYEIGITADVLQDGKVVDGLKDIAIPQLEEKIVLNLKIPESVRKSGRTYQIYHYKDQKAEVLNSETKDGTISFDTDSFSPYALVYAENANGGNRPVANSPRTGDGANMMLTLVAAMLSFAVGLTVFKMKKKTTYR